MVIKFEYTSIITQQHNGIFDRKYQNLYKILRETLNESTLEMKYKVKLWGECEFLLLI